MILSTSALGMAECAQRGVPASVKTLHGVLQLHIYKFLGVEK